MTTNEEFAADIRSLGITVISGPPVDLSAPLAKHLRDLGYRKTIGISFPEGYVPVEHVEEVCCKGIVLCEECLSCGDMEPQP